MLQNRYQNVGSGVFGELENEEDELAFLKRLKIDLNTACVRHTNLLEKKVKRVAICGGSGSFLLNNAIAKQADVFITGYRLWIDIIQSFSDVGYDERSMHMASYDWRLNFQELERRDGYFTNLKYRIEAMKTTNDNEKIVII